MSFVRNTVLCASAGTGKTHKLVQVYMELLEDGVDPLRILAMTFTEKAAAELRERIRKAIHARMGRFRDEEADVPVYADLRHPRWTQVLSLLPAAPISTIHGFCGLVLREHGMELGIDPSFRILDEQQSLDLVRESVIATIRHEIRGGNEGVQSLFADFGLENLVATIVSAGYWLNSLGKDSDWLNSRIQDQRRAAALLEAQLSSEIQKYGGDFEAIGKLADEVEARKTKQHPLYQRDRVEALLPMIGQIAGVVTASQLSNLLSLSCARAHVKKRSSNVLDFDDLLLGVRDLLRHNPRIQEHYRDHFQSILVDEFQDTDEVQAEIVQLLAQHPHAENRFAERKLLIVGDPKQSIYRFRRARVTVFFNMLTRIQHDGGVIDHLQENYRSAAELTEFSNRLSQSMMNGKGMGPITDRSMDLSYRIRFSDKDRLVPKSPLPFLGITYIAAASGARAAVGRQMEAEAIARLLENWKADETIHCWKEVGILLRTMTNVEVYLQALRMHRIPVYVVQGAFFYQKPEVSDLIAMLELILHPEDALLRATVLTSPLAGFTFEQLLEDKRSAELEEILKPWVEKRDQATAAEILQDVIRRTNFDVVMMAQENGRQRVANIGKLIEITRDLARQGTTALDDVVRHLRDRALDNSVREPEAQIVGEGDDVVRILTVHQAKGLEFDTVIIPDLATRAGRASTDRTFFSDRWGLLAGAAYGLHRKPLPHALILQSREHDEDQQYEEEKRLLYVAVTRARKMLVLGEGFSRQSGPWLQWIHRLVDDVQPGAVDQARDGTPASVRFRGQNAQSDFSVHVIPAAMDSSASPPAGSLEPVRRSGLRPQPETPSCFPERVGPSAGVVPRILEMTVSELAALDGCLRRFRWGHRLALPGHARLDLSGESARKTGMLSGVVAHKILETHGATPETVPELEEVLSSAEWRDLVASGPELEVPFVVQLWMEERECLIRGRMDAVVPGRQPRVVDYKYLHWRNGHEEDYEIQMTAYSLALMKALEVEQVCGEVWYLKSPMKIVKKEYRRAEAEDRLGKLLAKYIAAVTTDQWTGSPGRFIGNWQPYIDLP